MLKLPWSVAAVAALAVGCGDVKNNQLPDAPVSTDAAVPSDAAPEVDATPSIDAAPPGPVQVTVLSTSGDGLADPSARVVFQNPDGSVVADVAVDAAGHAQAMMPDGGSVTTIRVTSDTADALTAGLSTIRGVKPADDLTFGIKAPPTIVNQGGQTTMKANFTPVPDAAAVTFFTACSGSLGEAGDPIKGGATLTFRDSCHGAKFDLLGIASGGKLPAPQFINLTNIDYAANGTFTIPGSFVAMSTFTAALINVPDVITSLQLTRSSILGDIPVAPQQIDQGDPPAGAFAVTVPFPQGVGTRSDVAITVARADAQSTQTLNVRSDALSPTATFDMAALPLPWITTLRPTPTGATWTTVDPGGPGDGMMMLWNGRWTDGTLTTSISWRIAQADGATGVTLPALPAAYARLDPAKQTVTVTPGILAVFYGDYDRVTGYDELRRMPETLLFSVPATLGAFAGMPYQRRISQALVLRRL